MIANTYSPQQDRNRNICDLLQSQCYDADREERTGAPRDTPPSQGAPSTHHHRDKQDWRLKHHGCGRSDARLDVQDPDGSNEEPNPEHDQKVEKRGRKDLHGFMVACVHVRPLHAHHRQEDHRTHSITLSASASKLGGTVMPNFLAVLRLTTKSYFDDISTRHSPATIRAHKVSLEKNFRRKHMLRKLIVSAATVAALTLSTSAFAQGTAAEAKAMLEKAIAAVKADKAKAITSFKNGTDGFKDRDLYPFCFNISDGITQAAPPSVLGKDVRTLKDAKGNAFGADIYKAADAEGKINEVSYEFPKPGATDPSPKTSFVTKVGDLGCGVGYYK